jgi:fermentation-respiration switch protein FrsA (DUF1100 family)
MPVARKKWYIVVMMGVLLMSCRWVVNFLAFYPDRSDLIPRDRLPSGVQERFIQTTEGIRLQCYWVARPEYRRLLIYFHGNAGNIGHRLPDLITLADMGLNVLGVGYRGYGRSSGRPSEQGIYADGQAAMDYAVRELGFQTSDIVLFGRSIGSTVAVEVGRAHPVAAVILVSPITSGKAAGRLHFGPLAYLAGDAFDNLSKIGQLHSPLLIIHGTEDEVLPFDMGRQLFAAAKDPKYFEPIQGASHNDLSFGAADSYWRAVQHFLDRLSP